MLNTRIYASSFLENNHTGWQSMIFSPPGAGGGGMSSAPGIDYWAFIFSRWYNSLYVAML